MDSLLRLCAHRVVAQCSLPTIPAHLYPVLFQAAFRDGRHLFLWYLVATWPFKELHVRQLVGHLELHWDHRSIISVQAIIQAVVAQLQRKLEEPSSDSSRCQLRILDMTGFWEDPDSDITKALVKACVEVSKHQQEFQRHRPKQHKGCSGATTATPQPPGVDVHTDLYVSKKSNKIVRDALQTGASAPLRIKCHKFQPRSISASDIVNFLQCLDPSCLRRVELRRCRLKLSDILEILPHLSRFPELRSLSLQCTNIFGLPHRPELANGIPCLARQLGMLPSLRELSLEYSQVSGNLHQILGNLQTPLESLELPFCSLIPDDLAFLSQSFHAPALKRLKLSSYDISQGLLEPLRLLLEKASASLLHLDLSYCYIADSHLAVLLPTLLRCSRLRFLGLNSNPLSRAAIKDLLQKTLELPNLHLVVYPYPLDCYTGDPSAFEWHLGEFVDAEILAAAKSEFFQILVNSGRTDIVWTDDPDSHKAPDYFSL
ncbi:leucine-rich repeat-containing protein 14-like isoform X2 [Catharus ustulatus]|nr:leucine-rich repeat-containing protein 14-like isoform X2 [Catharus ustulatus]